MSQSIPPGLMFRSFLTVASGYVLTHILFYIIALGLGALFFPEFMAYSKLDDAAQEKMMAEQLPFLQKTADLFAAWAEANPDIEIPRAVGMADFAVEGVTGQRIAPPFSLWMLQRPLDYYRNLPDADKLAVDEFLSTIDGASAFRDFAAERRLAFKNFKLGLA